MVRGSDTVRGFMADRTTMMRARTPGVTSSVNRGSMDAALKDPGAGASIPTIGPAITAGTIDTTMMHGSIVTGMIIGRIATAVALTGAARITRAVGMISLPIT